MALHRVRLAVMTVAFAASLACQSVSIAGLTPDDEAAIRRTINTEMQAANAADAAGWAALYTQDAIVLRPHGAAVEGRDAIEQWLSRLPVISNATGETVEVVGYRDLGYARGIYSMRFSLPGVPMPIEEKGKFLLICRKQNDGSWKIAREIYNSDLPLAFPVPTPPATPAPQ